jgi:hypothetical protein
MESSLMIAIVNTMTGPPSGSEPDVIYLVKENGIDLLVTQGDILMIPEQ